MVGAGACRLMGAVGGLGGRERGREDPEEEDERQCAESQNYL